MKINNIFRAALCMVALASVTTSCRFEEEDLFDETASQRQEHTCSEVRNILVSASDEGHHGWVLQYFVAGNDDASYPGFNMFCKFYKTGCITIGGDHKYMRGALEGIYAERDSYYEINKDEAITIALTTWNDILSPFANPDEKGVGMRGDCNLVVMGYNNNEILLRGTRHSARSRLARLEVPYDEYIAAVKERQAAFTNTVSNPFSVKKDGAKEVYLVDINTGRLTQRDRTIDPLNTKERALVFTPGGFRTETVCESFDKAFSFQEFVYNAEKDIYVEKNDHSVTLDVTYPNASEFFMHSLNANKKWIFDPASNASDDVKELMANIVNANKTFTKHKFTFYYSLFYKKAYLMINYNLSTAGKTTEYSFDLAVTDEGIKLSNPELSNAQGVNDANGKKILPAVEALVEKFTEEFVATDTQSRWQRNDIKINFGGNDSYVIMK